MTPCVGQAGWDSEWWRAHYLLLSARRPEGTPAQILNVASMKQYLLTRVPTSGKITMLDDGLPKLGSWGVGYRALAGAQVRGKGGKMSRDDPRLHTWPRKGGPDRWEGKYPGLSSGWLPLTRLPPPLTLTLEPKEAGSSARQEAPLALLLDRKGSSEGQPGNAGGSLVLDWPPIPVTRIQLEAFQGA